jgi:hypothetical protein
LGRVRSKTPAGHDAQEDKDLLDIEEGVDVAGEDDDLADFLLRPLTTDPVVREGLALRRPEGVGQGEGEQGQEDVAAHRRFGLFRIALQAPPLLEFAEGGVFDQTAQIVAVEDVQGLGDA